MARAEALRAEVRAILYFGLRVPSRMYPNNVGKMRLDIRPPSLLNPLNAIAGKTT
jgi:hypothetical protein